MTEIDHAPARITSGVALVAAVATIALTGLYSWGTLVLGGLGLVTLGLGVFTSRQAAVSLGAALVFLGVVFAGIDGAPALVLLLGAVGTILAWDSASTALSLGTQLGRNAPTARLEVVRVTTTGLVGIGAVGGAYGLYTFAAGEGSLTAILFSLLGIVMLAFALR